MTEKIRNTEEIYFGCNGMNGFFLFWGKTNGKIVGILDMIVSLPATIDFIVEWVFSALFFLQDLWELEQGAFEQGVLGCMRLGKGGRR